MSDYYRCTGHNLTITVQGPPTLFEVKHKDDDRKSSWFDPLYTCEAPENQDFLGISFIARLLPDGGQVLISPTLSRQLIITTLLLARSQRLIDGNVHVWDRKFGQKIGTLTPNDGSSGVTVDTVIWNQKSALLAIAYTKGSVKLYHAASVLDQNLTAKPAREVTPAGRKGGKQTPSPLPPRKLPLPKETLSQTLSGTLEASADNASSSALELQHLE